MDEILHRDHGNSEVVLGDIYHQPITDPVSFLKQFLLTEVQIYISKICVVITLQKFYIYKLMGIQIFKYIRINNLARVSMLIPLI